MPEPTNAEIDDMLLKIHEATRSNNARYCLVTCKNLDQDVTCGGGIVNRCTGNYMDKHIVITNSADFADPCDQYIKK